MHRFRLASLVATVGSLLPLTAVAHGAADAHVHGTDLGSLLLLAVIAGVAVWIDRRTGR